LKKLNSLLKYIKQNIGEVNGRGFVDSAPLWREAGHYWIGKNGNLITKEQRFIFFLLPL